MPKATPAEKISTISGSTTAHASLVRPSAFQLAVIRACSAFISAKLLLCAIPKPPAYHSLRERNRPARLYRQLKRRRLGSPLCTKEDTRISHLAAPFFAFVAPGFPPFCGGPDDFCREARHLSSPVPRPTGQTESSVPLCTSFAGLPGIRTSPRLESTAR